MVPDMSPVLCLLLSTVCILNPTQDSHVLQEWLSQMTAAVQPFIPDHAVQFASQLLGFLASKLTMQAHDRAVFGDMQSACTPPQLELNHSGVFAGPYSCRYGAQLLLSPILPKMQHGRHIEACDLILSQQTNKLCCC